MIAVEEVLGVEEHPTTTGLQEADGVGHHGYALIEAGPQGLCHVVCGGLADDAHHVGLGGQKVGQRGVLGGVATHPPGGPEGHQGGPLEGQLGTGPGEELLVLGVGSRPAPFDVVNAEAVELLGDAQLVVDGQRNSL